MFEMTESCSSSEMDVSSASLGKPEKICLVCGDKALGYNFNAVSCESCKAFFRRNAHKTIRGRCEGRCEVTVESRSFCKRCRLAKCFTVGMRKDMILNEEQKKQRKQKIITNKLRRQGQLPQGNILPDGTAPYDTHPPHHYLKPESTADLAMMELTGAGKHGRDYLQQGPHHPLAGHRMGRYPYPPQELYNMGHGYSPNLGKSVPAASTPSSSAYGAGPGFQTSSMLPLSPTSSSPSLLQHEKYYSNQHHHRRHHYQQQQQQHLYHNHQHRRPQQQQHLSHQDGQFYSTRPLVAMKQERFGHLDQGNQICREKKEASSSSLRPHVESQIPGVQLVHIKQEVPDSISDSPEASSTHSPPMTKVQIGRAHV